ncbi:hypothetical protein DOTSEDRAFT_123526 [Dothistroma septosporum NZE10]|uniref:Mediator of RNA polymerase II transcription subunit 21 n=1 Tax=Dothistroma septosporum (strain NZE10 / CBS 128990) TaxID=675120 RepID=N1PZR4_DOTSN|nr:hypothetical protein DOTSEDRAFT_123526 [Dothistroma septosporum NZE10]
MSSAADSLTQLQDCVDTMLTMMYANLKYIQDRAPYSEIEGQPSQAPQGPITSVDTTMNGDGTAFAQNGNNDSATPVPEGPNKFTHELEDRAKDLVLQQKAMEYIIERLPGLGTSEAEQEKRMRELQVELRQLEQERALKELEKDAMVDLLGEAIGKIQRIP